MAALALLGGVWLLAGPKQEASAPSTLGGPGLSSASGSSSAGGYPSADGVAKRPKVRHVVVHVAGAVRHPGVYKLRAPGRLIDAVRRAGGLTPQADMTQVNLAAHLTDGRQIIVPWLPGEGPQASGAAPGASVPGGSAAKVSLSSATAEQLEALDGVGPSMAAKIIELRTKLGGFTRLDQLDDVPGVGEKRLASLRQQLDL